MPIPIIEEQPLNSFERNVQFCSPGKVGSVGDVMIAEKLKSTFPGEFRWDKKTSGQREPTYGSNVSDGTLVGYTSAGGPARTFDTNWGGRREMKTAVGWVNQDLRAEDRSFMEILGETPQYAWRNQIATVEAQSKTGNLFKFNSGGLINAPRGPLRGNQPKLIETAGGGDVGLYDLIEAGFSQYDKSGKIDSGYYDRQRINSGLKPIVRAAGALTTGTMLTNRTSNRPVTGRQR